MEHARTLPAFRFPPLPWHGATSGADLEEAWCELLAARARAEALVPLIAAHLAVAELEVEAIRRSVPVPGMRPPGARAASPSNPA
ncbi:MAG TPA: hypothetical protein VFZ16_04930 [Hyphomicrobiaceae bacterium]|nr:hypothetical protein [Hyphomicrobiaceae bacterium]